MFKKTKVRQIFKHLHKGLSARKISLIAVMQHSQMAKIKTVSGVGSQALE